jgi:large repetitive protein
MQNMKHYFYLLPLMLCVSLNAQNTREGSEGLNALVGDKASCQSTQPCSELKQSFRKPKPSFRNSFIIYPAKGSTITSNRPTVIGIVRNGKKQPLKKVKVHVTVDDKQLGTARTNTYGVWSHVLKPYQGLSNGLHTIAAIDKSLGILLGQTSFYVATKSLTPLRTGNVDSTYSVIAYPSEDAFINTTTPPIVGFVNDSSNNPVEGETITLSIDNTVVASVVSDSNGVFSYILDDTQALTEGNHTVSALATQSSVALQSQNFTIDVTPPAAPVITSPTQNSTVNNHLIPVVGTTEPYATIVVLIDGDDLGVYTTADQNGDWSIDIFLSNGNHSITAQAQDIAFNLGPVSAPVSIIVSA